MHTRMLTPRPHYSDLTVTVSWNGGFDTYTATVTAPDPITAGSSITIVNRGRHYGDLPDPQDAFDVLEPYAFISGELRAVLLADQRLRPLLHQLIREAQPAVDQLPTLAGLTDILRTKACFPSLSDYDQLSLIASARAYFHAEHAANHRPGN